MRRGLSSFLTVWILAALFGLAFESTGALAAAGSSDASRPSASQQSASQPTHRSDTRTPSVVTAPGEGLSSPRGSAAVRTLQRRLQRAGDNPGPVDGRYGPLTQRAVQRFQAAHGLPVDGIAGRHTWVALRAPNPVLSLTAGYGTPAGSQSVRALQRRLQEAGDQPGPVDGRYGPLTQRAVQRFQAAHHLPADGIAGPRTVSYLRPKSTVQQPREITHRRTRPATHPARSTHPAQRPRAAQPNVSRPARGPAKDLVGAHPGGPAATDWLVILGVVVLGILLIVAVHTRHRRASHPSKRLAVAPATDSRAQDLALEQHLAHDPESEVESDHDDDATVAPRFEENGDATAAFNLGVLLEAQGDLAGAEAAYRRADEHGDALAAMHLGLLLETQQDLVGAEAAYRRANERGDATAALDLGLLLEAQGNLAGAQAAYQRADEGGDATAALNLGLLLEAQQDPSGAEAAYRRADERGDALAAFNLGVLLTEQGDLAGAEAAYRRADERGDTNAAFNLGLLLTEQGDLAGAEAAYRHADQQHGDANAALHLGRLLETHNDLAGAEAAYQRAAQGDDEAAGVARDALRDLQQRLQTSQPRFRRRHFA